MVGFRRAEPPSLFTKTSGALLGLGAEAGRVDMSRGLEIGMVTSLLRGFGGFNRLVFIVSVV